ncbi:quinoprotein relay system zinc metallohydrolase 1 [Cupriavidus gilardii]|nr:quinoprotein relay system zinc metallohydrolase 1 [Cupriavidus gilardii]
MRRLLAALAVPILQLFALPFSLSIALLIALLLPAPAFGDDHAAGALRPPDYRLAPRGIGDGIWLFEGANADFAVGNGCNIINTVFIDTGDGVVVVNTGPSRRYGEQQRAAIARVTKAPVRLVLNLNLHPDYFFGNQAYADASPAALAGTVAGAAREAGAYADNLYRLCGDWMAGTEPAPPVTTIEPGPRTIGRHRFELLRLQGHTGDDLVLIDHTARVMFAGGLAFRSRIPTTPHADIPRWLASLDVLERRMREDGLRLLVPSHGPALDGGDAIAQTRDYLRWLDARLRQAAREGRDLAEVIAMPVPAPYSGWAAMPAEYLRNVTHLYPAYEREALAP